MRWLRILRLRLRSLFQRAAIDRDLEDELRFHFDHQVEQNIAAGMDPEEARMAAVRQFGGLSQRKDECRDARRTRVIESFFEDCWYAIRNLRHDPFLAFTATLTLAVCIGANTTVFSVANSILIRPLPYPNSERIDWIGERTGTGRLDIGAAPDYFALCERSRIFEEVAAFNPITANWTGVERPEQLDAGAVSPSFFRVMGMQPLLGRSFASDEDGPKAPPVVVLSYEFWRNRLGGDPNVLGKTIALNRLPRTIIGVMPQGFNFPRGAQLWVPLGIDKATQSFPLKPTAPIAIVNMIARRKADVTEQQTVAELNRLTFEIRAMYPKEFRKLGFRTDEVIGATSLQEHLTGDARPAILVLTGAVGLVILIACANIANLLLARAGSRQRELAVRLALGSGRGRIVRQMLTESMVLAAPGAVAGIGLAWIAVHLLNAAKPAILVRYPETSMDWHALAFTVVLMLAASFLFGMTPALSAAGIHIHDALKSAGLTHSAGRTAVRAQKVLIAGELGVSLVLLIAAGLLTRSFLHLAHTELGFNSDHVLSFRVNPTRLSIEREQAAFFSRILDRVQHVAGVRSATLATDIPLTDDGLYQSGMLSVVGRPAVPIADRPIVVNTVVGPEYFVTLQIPFKAGRIFDAHDFVRPSETVDIYIPSERVVVNEAFVHLLFPGEDPLGRQVAFGPDERRTVWTIVGVVGNMRSADLGADPRPVVYRCTCSGGPTFRAGFLIRTTGEPKALIRSMEQQVQAVDRDQPISDVKTMDQRRDAALAPERFQLILLGSFAVIAIVLATAGVYGTMSYLVTRRTREIGIRMAMGARQADVLRMVLGETTVLVLFAIAAGIGGAWAVTRYIRSMLYGVSELDPTTFALTSVLLAAIVLIASLGPTRHAVRVDPMTALREE